MLNLRSTGYAVMSEDLTGISFESISLDDCKRYLHKGYVIAERIPKVCGFTIVIDWLPCAYWYKPIYFPKYGGRKNILWLNFDWYKNYRHQTGKIIFENKVE